MPRFNNYRNLAIAIHNRVLVKHASEGASGFGYNMQYKPKIQFKPAEVPQLAKRMASDFKGVSDIPANFARNSNFANFIPSAKVNNVGPFKSLEFSPNSMPYKFDMDDQYYKDSTGNRQNPYRRDSADIDLGLNIKGSF